MRRGPFAVAAADVRKPSRDRTVSRFLGNSRGRTTEARQMVGPCLNPTQTPSHLVFAETHRRRERALSHVAFQGGRRSAGYARGPIPAGYNWISQRRDVSFGKRRFLTVHVRPRSDMQGQYSLDLTDFLGIVLVLFWSVPGYSLVKRWSFGERRSPYVSSGRAHFWNWQAQESIRDLQCHRPRLPCSPSPRSHSLSPRFDTPPR